MEESTSEEDTSSSRRAKREYAHVVQAAQPAGAPDGRFAPAGDRQVRRCSTLQICRRSVSLGRLPIGINRSGATGIDRSAKDGGGRVRWVGRFGELVMEWMFGGYTRNQARSAGPLLRSDNYEGTLR